MLKQASVLGLLCAAIIGLNPVLNLVGCYPHDYDPTTPEIDPPSREQIDQVADVVGPAAASAAVAAGQPLLAPILDLAARLGVLISAWFIARKYPKETSTTPVKG